MSNVWESQNQLTLEYLEKLANQLRSKEQLAPAELEEQVVRLLATMVILLRQHRVNKRGQCQYCSWRVETWRLGLRRPRCTVYRALGFALVQRLDVVWWQLLDDRKV